MIKPRTIEIPRFHEPGWELRVIEGLPMQRVFWVNFDAGHVRTGHATRVCEQVLFAQQGEIQISTEHISGSKIFILKPTGRALYLPEMTWRSYKALSRKAVLLAICSHTFIETDYIRDHKEFQDEIRQS